MDVDISLGMSYGNIFAHVYNNHFSLFAVKKAPLIRNFFLNKPVCQTNSDILDLCCGTGQLALYFLKEGHRVVGVDMSKDMLYHAKKNTEVYIERGSAHFLQQDVTKFHYERKFGLVVSTYNSINHLKSLNDLRNCFKRVYTALESNGLFIFDLVTISSSYLWTRINVTEGKNIWLTTQGVYNEDTKNVTTRTYGFAPVYENICFVDDTVILTLFELNSVREILLEEGWNKVYFSGLNDLSIPLENPEKFSEVFVIANKHI